MTTMLRADGIGDWLSDTSDDILKRIAAGTVEANQWMMLKAIDQINSRPADQPGRDAGCRTSWS